MEVCNLNQPYYKRLHIYHTGIHSKIVRLTSHERWSIYGWFMTTFSPSCRGEWPSFKHITLYQLCYWKVTHIYGLTQEEIETLIMNPDPQTPSHHQVDPRIIKAYLTGESVPTYLPGHWLSRYFGILPTYLPRDWFLPSELVVPLVNAHYCQDYHIWKLRLDANTKGHWLFS
jgi:hypothetical protein